MRDTGDHYELFAEIATALDADGAVLGQMFGHPCIKVPSGKVAATYWHDYLLVKLPPQQHQQWLARNDVLEFAPTPGRIMRGWAQIPSSYADDWEQLVSSAFTYVSAA